MKLRQEIQSLAGRYSTISIDAAEFHAQALREYELAWSDALHGWGGIPNCSPVNMARLSRDAWNGAGTGEARLLGIAGPGAVGKDALESRLRDEMPGMRKIVSSTTRVPRPGEIEGIQYHFLDQRAFQKAAVAGEFLLVQHREGRGDYGVSRDVLCRTLTETRYASIQESPQNLDSLGRAITPNKDLSFAIAYLLPPAPVFANLLLRFFTRTLVDGAGPFDETVIASMHSTLGLRQVTEFCSAVDLWQQGSPLRFLVNADLDVTARLVHDDYFTTEIRASYVA
jgi:Guanylate kinase